MVGIRNVGVMRPQYHMRQLLLSLSAGRKKKIPTTINTIGGPFIIVPDRVPGGEKVNIAGFALNMALIVSAHAIMLIAQAGISDLAGGE